MRVATQQIFGVLLGNFQRISAKTLEAQQQVSSGKRVTMPSDDPVAFNSIVVQQENLEKTQQWLRNIDAGVTRLQVADGTLAQVGTILARIRELAIAARSDTTTASDRTLIAAEVRSLGRELLRLANTDVDGHRVFAGTETDIDPFVITSGDTVQYLGNTETQSIAVGHNQTVQVTLAGSEVFTGPSTSVFDGVRNLLSALESNNGSGIETGIGDLDLMIRQVSGARGRLGASENRLESAKTTLTDAVLVVKRTLSQAQDVDLAEAIANLTKQQAALEAAALSASRIFDNSLLNFLR